MKIYFYDKDTKEYLDFAQADKDPAASKRTGNFVPLIPAYATLIKPPVILNNQIQVFNTDKNEWEIFSDYRKNFCKIDKDLNVSEITEIGDITSDYILVTKDIAEEIKKLKDKFKIENNKIVQKSDEEYQKEQFEKAKQDKYRQANDGASAWLNSGNALYEFEKGRNIEASDSNLTKMTAYNLAFITGQLKPDDTVIWVTKEDESIELTKEQISEIILGIGAVQARVWSVQFLEYAKLIDNAETIEELEKIVIDYGA